MWLTEENLHANMHSKGIIFLSDQKDWPAETMALGFYDTSRQTILKTSRAGIPAEKASAG